MSTATRTSSSGGALKTAGVIVLIIGAVGFASSQGWFGGRQSPEEERTEQERERVTWEVIWGQVIDTGETYEDTGKPRRRFECDPDRVLDIRTYVDGEETRRFQDETDHDPDQEGRCMWRFHEVVPRGSELRMVVTSEGYMMCQIRVNDVIALPNGIATSGGPTCEVWALAF